mmetsp:Transcript_42811/g.100369  ORF Transcript_42811/g.100369 Transcript_42811/m.100369 type:complete len:755 (+) Transcript_42811:116-2380(+)
MKVAAMDLSIKPSLAQYEMRPERLVPTRKPEANRDEALLEMVERQAGIAHRKMMCGEPKQACWVLRRAFLEADAYTRSQVPAPPGGRLALAAIRLNICIVLSRVGQHERALLEAKGALYELEDMWRTVMTASAEDEVAVRNGDVLRRFDPVIMLLRKPPSWLEKAVEVCVQVRQCIALELEYGMRRSAIDARAASSSSSSTQPGAPPAMSEETWLEIERLHKEGVALATDLLPARHEVRANAERCFAATHSRFVEWIQARRRAKRMAQRRASRGEGDSLNATAACNVEEALMNESPAVDAEPSEQAQAAAGHPEAHAGEEPPSEEHHGGPSDDAEPSGLTEHSNKHEGPPALQEIDVSPIEMPELLRILDTRKRLPIVTRRSETPIGSAPGSPEGMAVMLSNTLVQTSGDEGRGPSTPEADAGFDAVGVPPDMTASDFPGAGGLGSLTWTSGLDSRQKDRDKDPFAEWRRTVANRHHMNLLQRTMRQDEGLMQLKEDLKRKSGFFKQVWLKDLDATDPNRLFDNRALYSTSSVRLRQKVHERIERSLSPPDEEDAAKLRRKEIARDRLFKHYGVQHSGSEPSFSNYVKLMANASPAEQERLQEQEQLRKQKEFADRMRREAEKEEMIAKIKINKTKSGHLTTANDGGIYGYLGQLAHLSFERARLESAEKRGVRSRSLENFGPIRPRRKTMATRKEEREQTQPASTRRVSMAIQRAHKKSQVGTAIGRVEQAPRHASIAALGSVAASAFTAVPL